MQQRPSAHATAPLDVLHCAVSLQNPAFGKPVQSPAASQDPLAHVTSQQVLCAGVQRLLAH
jgi:hypothetical protein